MGRKWKVSIERDAGNDKAGCLITPQRVLILSGSIYRTGKTGRGWGSRKDAVSGGFRAAMVGGRQGQLTIPREMNAQVLAAQPFPRL